MSRAVLLLGSALLFVACPAPAPGPDAGPLTGDDAGPSGACPAPSSAGDDVVVTPAGTFRGTAARIEGVRAFLGIPFAAPPTGARRFLPPAPAACPEGVVDAAAFGPLCPQLDRSGDPVGDEDCLQLNVWAPESGERLPVLLFVHGGGNNQGGAPVDAAGVPIYDGAELAARGAVVVTTNYRLGALGYLVHPRLSEEDPRGTSGNYGLLDQIAALEWVQRNIADFGGDPERVLLFGESAGGVNTCALLTSPKAEGLFARALIESGGCAASSRANAEAAGAGLVDAAGCAGDDPIGCLRGLAPAELLGALPQEVSGLVSADFGPSVDDDVLPRAPSEALFAGDFHDLPVVLGTNADETASFLVPATVDTEEEYLQAARNFLRGAGVLSPTTQDAILAAYPASAFASPWHAMVALTTDWRWTCAARLYLGALDAGASSETYRYFFTQGLDGASAPVLSRLGAYHAIELFYLFGSLEVGGYVPTDDDLALSDAMQRYWVGFAATGSPNAEGLPVWPTWSADSDAYLELGTPIAAGEGVRTERCDALLAALGG